MGILRAQYQGTVADALRSAATKCGDATSYIDAPREKNSIIHDLQAVIARVHKAPDGAFPASTLEELEALAWEVSHGPRPGGNECQRHALRVCSTCRQGCGLGWVGVWV